MIRLGLKSLMELFSLEEEERKEDKARTGADKRTRRNSRRLSKKRKNKKL